MPEKDDRTPIRASGGFIHELILRIKLFFLLFKDARINLIIKSIPLIAMGYVLMPINIPGPFDEVGVLVIGYYLFVELCPTNIVEEHMINLRNPTLVKMYQPPNPDSIVDAEYEEVEEPVKGKRDGEENKND